MIANKYLELIHGEVDGVNSPKETDRVQEYLARNPEAKKLHNDLLLVSNMLSKVEKIEPPLNLKKRVLNSINPDRYALPLKRQWFKIPLRIPVARKQALVAYAFIAGLFVGIVIYSFLEGGNEGFNVSDLYGTMLRPGSSEKLENGDMAEINLDLVSGTVKTKFSKDILLAQLTLNARREIEVILEFDENSLSFNGFGAQKSDGNNLSVGKDYFRLTNMGENKYFVVFNNKSHSDKPLNLKIFSSGNLLFQRSIPTGPKGG